MVISQTEKQLFTELVEIREKIASLADAETQHQKDEARLRKQADRIENGS